MSTKGFLKVKQLKQSSPVSKAYEFEDITVRRQANKASTLISQPEMKSNDVVAVEEVRITETNVQLNMLLATTVKRGHYGSQCCTKSITEFSCRDTFEEAS